METGKHFTDLADRIQAGEKSCQTCNESWNMPPSGSDMKEGFVEVLTLCLAKPCQQKLTDGTYPRLATLCRADKRLCGGKLWAPVQPPLVAEQVVQERLVPVRREVKIRQEGRTQQERRGKEEQRPRRESNRQPYKVR